MEFLSSGGSQKFTIYPTLISVDDGDILVDSKTISINETLLYGYNSKLDFMLSTNGSYQNLQYSSNDGFSTKSSTDFNSLWVGVNYQFDAIFGDFKPAINFQIPVLEKSNYQNKNENSSLKAFSTKLSFKNYLDPLISTFYISALKNFEKSVGSKDIKYPDSYAIGFDLSVVLNPKASINFNFAQRYQTTLKENGVEVNPSMTLPTLGLGATYSLNETNSLTISSSVGTSSNSPDSVVSVSLWHKF